MVRLASAVELIALVAALVLGGVRGVIALLVAATLARALRGQRWFDGGDVDRVAAWTTVAGVAIGGVALLAALAAGPLALDVTGHAIEWSTAPVVRGSGVQLAVGVVVAVATALAAELVYRRWLVERIAEMVSTGLRSADATERDALAGLATLAAVVGAAAVEAVVVRGDVYVRAGTLLAGLGLGALYVGAGRRIGVAAAARIAFEVGALVLQYTRAIG